MSTTHASARPHAPRRVGPQHATAGRPAPPHRQVADELERIERMWLRRLAHAGEGVPGA
jgi:hypothetical protein